MDKVHRRKYKFTHINHTLPHIYPLVFFCPSSWYDPSSFTQKCGLPAHWTPDNCNNQQIYLKYSCTSISSNKILECLETLTCNIRSSTFVISRPFIKTCVFPLLAFRIIGPPTFRWGLIILEGFCPSCSIHNNDQVQ